MRKHSITKQRQQFYLVKFREQDGKCAICGQADRLVVDHNHATGESRALLCYRHNTGLGMFQDDPELLEKAATYLRKKGFATTDKIIVTNPTKKGRHDLILKLLVDNPTINHKDVARMFCETHPCSLAAAQMRVFRVARKYGVTRSVTGPVTEDTLLRTET